MKSITFALALLAVGTALSSCTHPDTGLSSELVRVDSIMYTHPDSALLLLNEIPASATATPLNHATWCLLMTQARFKNYQEQSDSLLRIAHDYFMKRNNPQRKALALYLHGELCYERNDNEQAVDYLIQASGWTPYMSDYQLAYFIYSSLGIIYLYSHLDYAEEAIQKAYDYACKSKNKEHLEYALCLLARNESIHENWHSSIEYYQKAVEVAREIGDTANLSGTLNELVTVYKKVNDKISMLSTAREAFALGEKYDRDRAQRYSMMASVYDDIGKNDSAIYFADKAISCGNIYTRASAYLTKYIAYKKGKDYQYMIEAGEKYVAIKDSIYQQERASQLIEMNEKYDEQQVLNEKEQLKEKKDKAIWMIIGLLALVLFVATNIIYWYQRRLLHKKRTIMQHEDAIRQFQLRIYESEALQVENTTLQTYLRNRTQHLSNELIKYIGVLSKLKATPKYQRESDWIKVQHAIDKVYDNFTKRLREQIPSLSDSEIRLCCLIKLRLSVSAIAPVLSIEPVSVSKQKLRLKEHITKETGETFTKERTLDMWIWDY